MGGGGSWAMVGGMCVSRMSLTSDSALNLVA